MARDFLIFDMMSDVSKSVAVETVEKISIFDIEFHEENFYRICDIEELMDSIIQEGGVQENIVVRRNPNGSEYKYQLISGHRRVTASLILVKEGYSEFEFIHARVKNNMSDEDALYELIKANSTQRVRSEYEIVTEYLLLKKLAANKKANNEFKGKTRTFIAEFMGVSEAQVAIYNTIGTRLNPDLMELFAKEEIKISLAYEIAKLADDDQLALVDVYLEKGRLTSEDIKELISKKALPGQMTIETPEEKQEVSDSDTLEQSAAEENVSDSDTFEEPDIEYSVEENEPEADNIEVPDIEFSVEEKVSDSDTSENSNMAAERLYTINDIELEMETYRFRYERAIKSDIALKHIMEQQMLYDALTLLLDSIKKGESR